MRITRKQRAGISEVAERHRLRMVLLFGSAAKNQEHPHSDLDLAIWFHEVPVSLGEFSTLAHELHCIFPGRKVDPSILNHADPLFLKKITGNCRLLYGRRRDLFELKIYAFKRYQDYHPYFEMERSCVERFVKDMIPRHD